MTTIYVKNKLVSLRDGSFAVDENGANVFDIKGKLFSPTKKKFVCDMNGNRLFIVRNKFWHGFRKVAYLYDGQTKERVVKIKDRFFSNAVTFSKCEDEIVMESQGIFKGLAIYKNGVKIATWFRSSPDVVDIFRDSYRIDVEEGQEKEAAFLVSVMIAIDNMCDASKLK